MIKKIAALLVGLFMISALAGATIKTKEQQNKIETLEYELSTAQLALYNVQEQLEYKDEELQDTREQLTKVANQLNQFRVYHERENYIDEVKE